MTNKKLSVEEQETIRQIEWLARRFDAIADEGDLTKAIERLQTQEAFAVNLLQRLEMFEFEVEGACCGIHSGFYSAGWLFYEGMMLAEHPDQRPWIPGSFLTISDDGRINSSFGFDGLGPADVATRAMFHGEFCRWLAKKVATESLDRLRTTGRRPDLTKRKLINEALDNGIVGQKKIQGHVQKKMESKTKPSPKMISEVKKTRRRGDK